MPTGNLDSSNLGQDEDWEGNNAAFVCPICRKVFIVSHTRMHIGLNNEKGYRECPECRKSIARVEGGSNPEGPVRIRLSPPAMGS